MQDKLRAMRRRRHFISAGLAFGLLGTWTATSTWAAEEGPLLVLGDSLSAEYGLARGTGWVALLQKRLQESQKNVPLVNASVSGETTSGGRSRLPALLKQHKPSVVVIELGGNDALRGLPLQCTQGNLDAMVRAARDAGAKVLLVGMQVPPNYGNGYTRQFEQLFAKVAQEQKVPLVPFLLAGIGDAADSAQWFQADRIHPTAKAQPRMLDNVWPQLSRLLP
ncbi:arylesterase [Delftia acidovorans]|uniref:Arylesterase n=1 Tax=Delftia acidovorans TaxID=80866 RepID=A0A7T2S4W2_DELAC|nr:arylesterase [Delftia acidovorans]QPS08988.1 arylesterase [Delftia acidovorans]